MIKILTYGTFDVFHYGHYLLLERAKALGSHLTVAVSTDEFNDVKGKSSVLSFAIRRRMIQNLRFVDEVIDEDNWQQKQSDIKRHSINILVMGDDWKGKFDHLSDLCKIVYLPRTPIISSSLIKDEVLNQIDSSI